MAVFYLDTSALVKRYRTEQGTEFGELGAVLRQHKATDRDHAGHKETTDSLARSLQKFINFLLVPIA